MGSRAVRRQPNGCYRVNYYYWDQTGAKCRARKKFRTLHLAEAFHAERRREFEAKIRIGTRERVLLTVSQFLDRHYIPWASRAKRSWSTEKIFLKNVIARWGERRLSSISRVDVEKWRLELKNRVSSATVHRRLLAYLRSIFKFAHVGVREDDGQTIGGGFIGDNPMREIKSPKIKAPLSPPTILTPDEIARLKPDGTRGMYLVLFAMYFGMRRGEIFRLRYADVDHVAVVVRIPISKNNEPRVIPLTRELAEIIDRQPKNGSGCVFSWNGRQPKDCRSAVKLALTRAGITRRVRMHDLRHTYGSYLAMNGVDMDERMALMGHKTITAARIYTHFYTKKLSESVDRLMNAYRGAAQNAEGHEKGTEALAV